MTTSVSQILNISFIIFKIKSILYDKKSKCCLPGYCESWLLLAYGKHLQWPHNFAKIGGLGS